MKNYLLVASAALAIATSAQAVTVTSSPLDVGPGPGETVVLDFESATAPAGYSITGNNFGYYAATVPNVAAAPAGDTSQFLAVLGGGTATITLPQPLKSLSLYIGSVDAYNTITFSLSNNTTQVFTGTALPGGDNGDQTSGATNRRFFFTAEGTNRITGVTLASSQNSFEIDNLATSAVPEPAAWVMMIGGLALVGGAQRRRRSTVVAA